MRAHPLTTPVFCTYASMSFFNAVVDLILNAVWCSKMRRALSASGGTTPAPHVQRHGSPYARTDFIVVLAADLVVVCEFRTWGMVKGRDSRKPVSEPLTVSL